MKFDYMSQANFKGTGNVGGRTKKKEKWISVSISNLCHADTAEMQMG